MLEVEKKRKAEERELKAEEKRMKAAEMEGRRQSKRSKGTQSTTNKVFITRSTSGYATQHSESSTNECMMCFGNYADDISAEGTPRKEWVQCTSTDCSKWMHEECASKKEDGSYLCVCGAVFM